ncbi:DUF1499 domain-containing protein [uncultured Cocleimonas sp.]|uniref:DUF1499 domain-containing protein n=1 Tax=uncultured Cocleimonas sp. TaxID=1051587 RepID=UPI0026090ADA|nr:DUF1499 domain-containing protein [uncultured Cocleimonas sp.]
MKTALIIVLVLIALAIASFFILGKYSQKGQAPGLVNGSLSKCSEKPNCVCSEYKDDVDHYVLPLGIDSSESQFMAKVVSIIKDMNGVIQTEKDHYVAATFASSIFGFVDDFEIRIDTNFDENKSTFHFRSASRVGYSDAGVNKKRVEQFKTLYSEN